MKMGENTKLGPGNAVVNHSELPLLCDSINWFLNQSAPHIKQRETSKLLQRSVDEMKNLSKKIEALKSETQKLRMALDEIEKLKDVIRKIKEWDIEKTIEDRSGFRFSIPENLRAEMSNILDA